MTDDPTTPEWRNELRRLLGDGHPADGHALVHVSHITTLLDALDAGAVLIEALIKRLDKTEGELEAEIENRDSWEERLTSTIYSLATVEEVGEWTSSDDLDQKFIEHIGGRLQRANRAEAALERVRALTYASDDGTEWEHNERCQGEPDCPACWAADIRRAIEGDQP